MDWGLRMFPGDPIPHPNAVGIARTVAAAGLAAEGLSWCSVTAHCLGWTGSEGWMKIGRCPWCRHGPLIGYPAGLRCVICRSVVLVALPCPSLRLQPHSPFRFRTA